jgi:CAAD domains of cyanobacterial aminoacyl-tRNA synthetase
METPSAPAEYADNVDTLPFLSDEIKETEPAQLAELPPANESSNPEWQQMSSKMRVNLTQVRDRTRQFLQSNQQSLLSLGLIIALVIVLRVLLAALDTLNTIPLLEPILEMIGIGYVAWLTNRYLLWASTRRELSEKIRAFIQAVRGS